MNAKKITLIVLSVFVAVSIGYLVFSETREARHTVSGVTEQETQSNAIAQANSFASNEKQPLDRIVRVYYFHTTSRCPTCHRIEEYTKNAILSTFGPEIKKGTIDWKVLNVEEPQNQHFVNDFKLFTKSVVIVDSEKGKQVRWKNLERIWELVQDEQAFTAYIKNEVAGYLKNI